MSSGPDRPRAGSCFVIATRNRHDYLLNAVRSLADQTVLPAELCIVDASDETPARARIEQLCADAGIRLDYVHPAPRGLTIQRNLGIDRTGGDPVFLIDDDVWMAPDVHEEILAEYERWGPELGGVRGSWLRPPAPHRAGIVWRRFFGMEGWWPDASGRVKPGFFTEAVTVPADVCRVEAFNGWFMSFRREVFEHERFDENLAGYAFKEDADFSYRVSKRGYVARADAEGAHRPPEDVLAEALPSRPPAHEHGEPALPAQEEHAADPQVPGGALVGADRDAGPQRRQGRPDPGSRVRHRDARGRVGPGAGAGADRPDGRAGWWRLTVAALRCRGR